ncbi:carboxypeptidase regulatory-like domain-containing protein [Trinickia caryophylli]|uniref:Uncharacterized protein n=1 Tax=Trinickia caryophylli TaxID=28094 RepID=A0A1X7G9Z5_TRICW|nr:hypothetical protein [Trinickia caryophylli]PMS11362.1 hypothetical protein C0Z17_14550 [Trinickia caryophylli]TRX17554.1 carboxypeptidase regulatory-like domain-containing protein [Trinickia caryophylli]WQE11696.1 carboxypeptidase regulatory-like domain-containing protein [Trinickia caryophylli]SMF66556.1 hypothetical protein SAMN06295900_114129 [Trinickia caryophylli]GLU34881.1 hypothetical protein Busp01_47230 [Trinickia caryophylli]
MKRKAVVQTGLAAVVQLNDGFSGEPIADASVLFKLDQTPCTPLRKADGFFVFTHLQNGAPHCLDIACAGFFDAQVTLSVIPFPLTRPLAESIVVCQLEPSPVYPYPAGTTIVCGQVTSTGKPLAGVDVFALFSDRLGAWHYGKARSYGSPDDEDPCNGRYSLVLSSATGAPDVSLRFTKDGYTPWFGQVAVARSMQTIANADLQPAKA